MKYPLAVIVAVFLIFKAIPEVITYSAETEVQEFNIPVEAPDFVLKEIGGKEVSLKEYRGKVVLLNFFTTW